MTSIEKLEIFGTSTKYAAPNFHIRIFENFFIFDDFRKKMYLVKVSGNEILSDLDCSYDDIGENYKLEKFESYQNF